jgi:hypothetical protein
MDLNQRISIVLKMARFESPTQVQRELVKEKWPITPNITTIRRLYDKFCEFGTVLDLPRDGRPKISDEKSTDAIMEILAEKPKSTLTEISAATNLSRTTIQRRIKYDIGQKSYKLQIHQQLEEEDYDRRVEMAETLLPILQLPANKKLIYYSDEAVFHVNGHVHKQNCRIWGYEKQKRFG